MKPFFKIIFFGGALLTWAYLLAGLILGDRFDRIVTERRAEVVGAVADKFIASQSQATSETDVKTVAGLHHLNIEVEKLSENIFRATGVANSFLIKTDAGNVLFDTGLGTQAAKHKRLLQAAVPGPITHIILSHSHADHIGGTKYWQAEFPRAQLITHRRFLDGQRYLFDLQEHFWNRNRLLYTFMPEQPPDGDAMFAYGGLEPSILIDDFSDLKFTLGGVEFVLLPTPGAEGEDNLVLWLPQQKALLSGDFFGPLFPMMPNLFTLRGERFRDPVAYLRSLKTVMALEPESIFPSHFDPVVGKEKISNDLRLMHDATDYVHRATIEGMNAGKTVWQLMEDIQLPPHLNVSQGHGKVSWNVRSIWEYYSTWFKFESTTELYPVPVRTLYPELVTLIGEPEKIIALADDKQAASQPEQALHLIEIALTENSANRSALVVRLAALETLLERALQTTSNFSETGWLKARIQATQEEIDSLEQ